MPVTNSNKGKPLPYIERGGSGLPPKPNPDRPVGVLANNAGMAEFQCGRRLHRLPSRNCCQTSNSVSAIFGARD